MQNDTEQLDLLKKKVNKLFEMEKLAPQRKGDWPFMKAKKALEDEVKDMVKPPPPPSQALLNFLGQ